MLCLICYMKYINTQVLVTDAKTQIRLINLTVSQKAQAKMLAPVTITTCPQAEIILQVRHIGSANIRPSGRQTYQIIILPQVMSQLQNGTEVSTMTLTSKYGKVTKSFSLNQQSTFHACREIYSPLPAFLQGNSSKI